MRYKFMTYKIYKLVDPRYQAEHEDYVRYIGKTRKELSERLFTHLNSSKHWKDPKRPWFDLLKRQGLQPVIQLVETIHPDDSPSGREHYWIDYHDKIGYNLLNRGLTGGISIIEEIGDPVDARIRLEGSIEEATAKAALHSGFAEHVKRRNKGIEDMEQRMLDRINNGEFKEPLATKMKVILEGIIAKRTQPPAERLAARLDDMPAVKHYLEVSQERGDEWFIFYLGKEPSDRKREKTEARMQEARDKGWKGFRKETNDDTEVLSSQ